MVFHGTKLKGSRRETKQYDFTLKYLKRFEIRNWYPIIT
ncbi:Hypothetical protein I595_59 [Croceitalea dokdonensis DOKDO 023]|uniref:Uncharacterized protein n=1 Tax=Croceitalea dokdonensis DOKDO 023 TaxID=1300341 RepID=A0A0N8H4E6_9FLAO|nr:Hypothetical protein I595_59 [Croceitalea dokdonensis DOKDO 023]